LGVGENNFGNVGKHTKDRFKIKTPKKVTQFWFKK
jgi:hypothetical protein